MGNFGPAGRFFAAADGRDGGVQARPFDLPEGESELIAGYFTEYSGGKQAVFMLVDFAEIVLVPALITTFFFGGWQFPWLYPDGFHLPGGASSRCRTSWWRSSGS